MSSESKQKLRILVVDDHPIVRLGIRQMIDPHPDLEICGEAESAETALQLAPRLKPDLALVDLSLAEGTALGLIGALRERAAGLQVLVLSMHDEALFAERALRAGARGYIMKQAAIEGLIAAIRHVASGQIYVSEKMTQRVLERVGDITDPGQGPIGLLTALSNRELEVFNLIGQGKSTVAIAAQLELSVKTVETYRSNIKTKLNLADANDLVRLATSWAEGL
jgi:DNA-binding NarL/FixJ family response regulator